MKTFMNDTYNLECKFTSLSREPAVWAADHPKYGGQERAQISLAECQRLLPLVPIVRLLRSGLGKIFTFSSWQAGCA